MTFFGTAKLAFVVNYLSLENASKRYLLEEVTVGTHVLVDILDYCSGGGGGCLLLGEGGDHAANQESLQ